MPTTAPVKVGIHTTEIIGTCIGNLKKMADDALWQKNDCGEECDTLHADHMKAQAEAKAAANAPAGSAAGAPAGAPAAPAGAPAAPAGAGAPAEASGTP